MKRHLCLRCPSFERSEIQCHCSPTSLLAAISSHCLATLPAKMSAFKSDMRLSAYYRNRSEHLKICCHVITTVHDKDQQ